MAEYHQQLPAEQRETLRKVLNALRAIQLKDPDMPLGTVMTFLAVAAEQGLNMTDIAKKSGNAKSTQGRRLQMLAKGRMVGPVFKKGAEIVDYVESPTSAKEKLATLSREGQRLVNQIVEPFER